MSLRSVVFCMLLRCALWNTHGCIQASVCAEAQLQAPCCCEGALLYVPHAKRQFRLVSLTRYGGRDVYTTFRCCVCQVPHVRAQPITFDLTMHGALFLSRATLCSPMTLNVFKNSLVQCRRPLLVVLSVFVKTFCQVHCRTW